MVSHGHIMWQVRHYAVVTLKLFTYIWHWCIYKSCYSKGVNAAPWVLNSLKERNDKEFDWEILKWAEETLTWEGNNGGLRSW